jgi:hypothetical protein
VKKSWKLSDSKEYQTAPPYTIVERRRIAKIFLGRKIRPLDFGIDSGDGGTGGMLLDGRGGAAYVGDIGE